MKDNVVLLWGFVGDFHCLLVSFCLGISILAKETTQHLILLQHSTTGGA